MNTIAKPTQEHASHWYTKSGDPCYEVPRAKGDGMRKTTLADARKLNLLPSVTTVLKVLDKPALTDWKIEQAVLAAVTTPRNDGEALDAFIERVLHVDKVQDQEMDAARKLGTDLHAAMESLWGVFGKPRPECFAPADLVQWVMPAYDAIAARVKRVVGTETVLVGEGYAGKCDLLADCGDYELLCDWKTTKKLPTKEAWSDHRLQLAAYAKARSLSTSAPVRTANIYISTLNQGEFVVWDNPPWEETYAHGFAPLVTHWQWSTGYTP